MSPRIKRQCSSPELIVRRWGEATQRPRTPGVETLAGGRSGPCRRPRTAAIRFKNSNGYIDTIRLKFMDRAVTFLGGACDVG